MKRHILFLFALIIAMTMAVCAPAPADATGNLSGKTVSIITPYLTSVTTSQMSEIIKNELEPYGIRVTIIDTKGDFGDFASRIEDAAQARTDAIVLVSAAPGQVRAQVQDAIDAGVGVFGCDSDYMEGMQVNATSDNFAMGQTITDYLFNDLMRGEGKVIMLTHRPHPGVFQRSVAFDEALKANPNITLVAEQHIDVPGPIENARRVMENLILANSEEGSITGVWCAFDEAAIGATQALQAAGRNEVVVTGVDGTSQAIELIRSGSPFKATMAQNFDEMAKTVAGEIVKFLNGETLKTGDAYVPGSVITE